MIRMPVDAVRIGEVLSALQGLERLHLDGAGLEKHGVFWSLLKNKLSLRWEKFKDWALVRDSQGQNVLPQEDQPSNVINVCKLFSRAVVVHSAWRTVFPNSST